MQYYGVYADTIGRLYKTASNMPRIGDTETESQPPVYLHYYTETEYQKFSLSNLKSNEFMQLDFSWRA